MYIFQNRNIATGATMIRVFFCTNSQMNVHFCTPIIKLSNPFEIASAVHPRCKLFFPLTLLQHSLWSVVVVIVQYLSLYTNEKFSSELFATRPRVANNGGDHPDRKKKMKRAKLDTMGINNFWWSILVFITWLRSCFLRRPQRLIKIFQSTIGLLSDLVEVEDLI